MSSDAKFYVYSMLVVGGVLVWLKFMSMAGFGT